MVVARIWVETFGEWLKAELERWDMNQTALAHRIADIARREDGIDLRNTQQSVSNWANDRVRPKAESCSLIARALGIDELSQIPSAVRISPSIRPCTY